MTDYDDIRTCCTGAQICTKCWLFMTIALEMLHITLTEDFGFKDLLFVYSGRRGVHCWVCDPQARSLSSESRSQLADYIHIITGSKENAKKISISGMPHPLIKRAYEHIVEGGETGLWGRLLVEQNFFLHKGDAELPGHVETVLKLLGPNEEKQMRTYAATGFNSVQFWNKLQSVLEIRKRGPYTHTHTPTALMEIVLGFSYPRLDIHVSQGMNHLLKSPFCVHPKTSRVCVPIDSKRFREFNHEDVPTLDTLVSELECGSGDVHDTKLSHHIKFFEKFVCRCENDAMKARGIAKRSAGDMTF
eukprot:GHVR01155704.1.p1 GENE.GHVR01155704.1~~GHVR01155704.1.p1  ORF type:complete len:303 (+),score=49.80 GHVR01155704.1:398-1306(+)